MFKIDRTWVSDVLAPRSKLSISYLAKAYKATSIVNIISVRKAAKDDMTDAMIVIVMCREFE